MWPWRAGGPAAPSLSPETDGERTAGRQAVQCDLDAGLAAGFGKATPPRSSLGDLRSVLLKEAEGESSHVVKPKSDAMPSPDDAGDRYQLSGEIARGGMGAVLRGRDVDLGRDLAIKVLLEKVRQSSGGRQAVRREGANRWPATASRRRAGL